MKRAGKASWIVAGAGLLIAVVLGVVKGFRRRM
jgi:hypothetical protein